MIFVIPMREIQTQDINTGPDHALEDFGIVRRRPKGRQDFGSLHQLPCQMKIRD